MTLDQLFTRWMEDYVKINLSPASARIMQPIYDQYIKPYHGHRLLHEITRADVYQRLAEIYRDKPLSGSMLTKLRGCYSRPYRWAMHALDLNIDAPTNGLIFKIPKTADKPETRSRIITDQEWETFQLHAHGSKYLRYYQLLYMTGMRPSECLGLQVRDIKQDRLEIRRAVTRDGKSGGKNQAAIRDIPMTNEMRSLLSDHSASVAFHTPQGWLWATREGNS